MSRPTASLTPAIEGELLDEADFLDWCSQLRLTTATREMVATIRSEQPARCVGGGRRNVAGRYRSRKMVFTIQLESHRVELPFVHEAENDVQVREYYDQPSSIPLVYRAANGRNLSVLHAADYFPAIKAAVDVEPARSPALSRRRPNLL